MMKLTKRGILFLANGIALGVLIIFFVLITLLSHEPLQITNILYFLLIQCAFTLITLIVYYLSIIADAVSRRYKEREEKKDL